jgi:hypothetical protein
MKKSMEIFMNKAQVLQQFGFQRFYLSLLVDDISDEQMCAQPAGMPNHPAWHIGHLTWVADRMAKNLGATSTIDETWENKFKQGSIPTGVRADYPSKAELLRKLDDRRAALAHAFENATPEQLAAANPVKRLEKALATVEGLMLFGMVFHEATHLGQIASWRKAMGMVAALAKMGE